LLLILKRYIATPYHKAFRSKKVDFQNEEAVIGFKMKQVIPYNLIRGENFSSALHASRCRAAASAKESNRGSP